MPLALPGRSARWRETDVPAPGLAFGARRKLLLGQRRLVRGRVATQPAERLSTHFHLPLAVWCASPAPRACLRGRPRDAPSRSPDPPPQPLGQPESQPALPGKLPGWSKREDGVSSHKGPQDPGGRSRGAPERLLDPKESASVLRSAKKPPRGSPQGSGRRPLHLRSRWGQLPQPPQRWCLRTEQTSG